MSTTAYDLSRFVSDLRTIASATHDEREIAERVRPLARELALVKGWLEPKHYECDREQGFGVHLLHEEPDHTLAIFAIAWLPGRGAPPHNHGTWAVVAGVDGSEKNTFWKRLDDRSKPGRAKILEQGEKRFGPGDVLTLQPDAIHSVVNDGDRVTVSLHVYGKHLNFTGRSRFDPDADLEVPFLVTVA